MTFGLASAPLIFQSIVKAFVAPSFLPRWLAPPQCLQRHSEITDEIPHHECQIGRMDYERGTSQDFIFIGIRFCIRVGLIFPPPDMIVKILSRVRQLSSRKFCQARE
jgi:hypothetical protein